jgi:hypothetical protein
MPGFDFGGSVGIVGCAFLSEGQVCVPGLGIAVMHGSQDVLTISDVLGMSKGQAQENQ